MFYSPIIQTLISNPDHHLDVLRLDLIDKEVSGNKWFKLKYNLEAAMKLGDQQIITFGGAFSNHLAATAAACKKFNLKSIGVVRGEEHLPLNSTLTKAKENGMQLHFVSRKDYETKTELEFKQYLENLFGPHYLLPEGGNNTAGIAGCMEILDPLWQYDYIFCGCGTAATYTGLVASAGGNSKIIGISVLRGKNSLAEQANKNLKELFPQSDKRIYGNEIVQKKEILESGICNSYAFKGYARLEEELILFKQKFESEYKFELDYVYTSKLFYAVFDLLHKKQLAKGSKSLIIHSGGLQGNEGFENRYHLMPNR
jgi:1-aminocyclopropane-1-carboxylate deaminase